MESIDLNLLVTLDALLQEGSVTGAARRIGLSTPATSHALARIRDRLKDPVLVRSGRGMLLTPRALALKAKVHAVVSEARQALEPDRPFDPRELTRTFVIHATDYVLTILGPAVDRHLREEAPLASLRFMPNNAEDAARLRDGGADLAVGIYAELPQEMRIRKLITERLVAVVRRGHPVVRRRLTLEQYVTLPHIQVAPRGLPGGYVDQVLGERGLRRSVVRAVPYFLTALQLAAETDYILTIPERIAAQLGPTFGLEVMEVPLKLKPYALSLVWHPRLDADAGNSFLREIFARAARASARDHHPDAGGRPSRGSARNRRW